MNLVFSSILCSLLLVLALPVVGLAQGLPTTTPEAVDVSAEVLEKLTQHNRRLVALGKLPGVVTAVARRGKVVYFETTDMRDTKRGAKMRPDTIFRIASMTKPIASIGVMILYDDGALDLNDPVSKHLPEFKDVTYLDGNGNAVKPQREITIKHLLTHTAGFTYSSFQNPVAVMYREARIAEGLSQEKGTLEDNMKKLAEIPLHFPPGDQWEYGVSSEVLGLVIERVSGMMFGGFLRKRLFEPLKMSDTHFFLPPQKVDRLAVVYQLSKAGKLVRLAEGKVYRMTVSPEFEFEYSEDRGEAQGEGTRFSVDYHYRGPRNYFSGGAGLCSTVPDYLRFCQMILNDGELDGVRILKPKTVMLISQNQIGNLSVVNNPHEGDKFGLGFSIFKKSRDEVHSNVLEGISWGGFFRTCFLIHPEDEWIIVSMSQVVPDKNMSPWMLDIRNLAAEAIQ